MHYTRDGVVYWEMSLIYAQKLELHTEIRTTAIRKQAW
jgi:hypothetical protein